MKKSYYILIKMDDEYGYELFRGIAFTLGNAYSIVKQNVIENDVWGKKFHDWQLIKTDSLDEFYKTIPDNVSDTGYRIFVFDEDETKSGSLAVFATYSYKTETADEYNERNRIS